MIVLFAKAYVRGHVRKDGTQVRPYSTRRAPASKPTGKAPQMSLFDAKDQPMAAEPRPKQTETPEFKRWFGDSKVVGDDGKPLVVYHGTKSDIREGSFDTAVTAPQKGDNYAYSPLGGWFSDSARIANNFAGEQRFQDDRPQVLASYLSIRNPYEISYDNLADVVANQGQARKLRRKLEAQGHDGIKVGRHGGADGYDYVAFRPEQIKSATGNRGTFDPAESDMTKSLVLFKAQPTEAQAEAGNYRKGTIRWRGLSIAVENPTGSTRTGTDPDGHEWRTVMQADYGYIRRSKGTDDEHIDCYVGPDPDAPMVYVVNQAMAGEWHRPDEQKCMIGYPDEDAARAAYLAHYDDPRFLGSITAMTAEDFVDRVKRSGSAPRDLRVA